MSTFELRAVQRIVDQARAAGVTVPDEVTTIANQLADAGHTSYPARTWAEQHPDEADWPVGCCIGNDLGGPDRCTCWTPVFELEQQPPQPPERAEDITVRGSMCGDCAFRKGSPERAEGFLEEALFELAALGQAFYCHDGMRRPAYWQHPDGRRIEGSTADWQPPIVSGIPFRADGRPGMLCAGWMARAIRADARQP
ncbi:hypothetical protein ABZS66_19090 [Dactylosporangium sp. NPDC005572]|uniref:hypothetical protein n=1 Tax=Dactylosporangium sp. NPDC005572 TaxID=3156889 RepID=UPI0033AD423E